MPNSNFNSELFKKLALSKDTRLVTRLIKNIKKNKDQNEKKNIKRVLEILDKKNKM